VNDRDPNLVFSSHSGKKTQDGVTVEVSIIRLEHENDWTLEVVNDAGTSIVWDAVFQSDGEAMNEFRRTVAEEGMIAFLEDSNVVPFRR
jgi:hypothetical protein